MHTACHKNTNLIRNQLIGVAEMHEDERGGKLCTFHPCTSRRFYRQKLRGAEQTYCAIDEDPQTFASNSLQMLAIVQLSQGNFILHDVVL